MASYQLIAEGISATVNPEKGAKLYLVSYSESTDAKKMVVFNTKQTATIKEIIPGIEKYAWSPCIWQGGRRLKSKFIESYFCVLDFDDGLWTVDNAIDFLTTNNLAGIVGTTKSHQLSKGGGDPQDRFRLVIPWLNPITDLATYEQNMKRVIKNIATDLEPADRACSDGARFFWPCRKVVYYRPGKKLSWLPFQKPKPSPRRAQALRRDTFAKLVPTWMRQQLQSGIIEGTRNKTAYVFAKRLKERGFTCSEAYDELSRYITLDDTELSRTISSAYK